MDRQETARITLREACGADAAALAEIHIAAWRAAYRGLMPERYLASLSLAQRTSLWAGALSRSTPAKLAIAQIDGNAAGFCLFGPTRDEGLADMAEIYAVNIHPRFWRRGAGRALCAHALSQASERHYGAMTLWTLKENHPARRFYESLGYAADGAERTDTKLIGSPLHEMRYYKEIA